MLLLELHDKPFDYLLKVENEYNKVVKRFDTKTKEYFDALRELRKQYNKDYDALNAEANKLIYGNPEGKFERKHRDRSDLYIKVVKRSQKYKKWNKFFTIIGDIAALILIVQILGRIFNFIPPFINNNFGLIIMNVVWLGFLFNFIIELKSIKYASVIPKNTRAEKKWLKKYFESIRDIIGARAYLEVLVQREEAIEKYLNASDTYIAALDAKSEVISKMKKDVEKVIDDFMHDADINTALDHVLESWKNYR